MPEGKPAAVKNDETSTMTGNSKSIEDPAPPNPKPENCAMRQVNLESKLSNDSDDSEPPESSSISFSSNSANVGAQKLRVDAVVEDGILAFLNSAQGERTHHHRALSASSRAQLDAHRHQVQFQVLRNRLQKSLEATIAMLIEVNALNKEASLSVIPRGLIVLGVDVRLGAGGSVSASHSPAPSLVASRLQQVIQHASRLQVRLQDTASRVLVTGDLNAGKSSLCNALLRRPVLPTDQQPCTDVFCEVVNYEKNNGIEEVHAVKVGQSLSMPPPSDMISLPPSEGLPLGEVYNRDDRCSYDVFSISELDQLVHEPDKYRLLVIYLRDSRPASQSLLNNGVVDICLIDAPGLNVSAVTTTELFGRQEEIDLVIFVVSAENHFTQSANEFVTDAASEKSLLFIAVNHFDKISDKERCKTRVLSQVKQLAPDTHKGASDFVHFVSSKRPDSGDPDETDPHSDQESLDRLEDALRNFILDKRSASKLEPARTYMKNVLADLILLSEENRSQALREITEYKTKVDELTPSIDSNIREYALVTEQIDRDSERLCSALQLETIRHLLATVSSIGEQPVVEWTGLMQALNYAHKTREVLVKQVLCAVEQCEESARQKTATAVNSIKQIGVLHVGEQPAFLKVFNQKAMFKRRRDNLSRVIQADFAFADMFDIAGMLERPLPVLASSKQALVSAANSSATMSSALGGALTVASLYQAASPTVTLANRMNLILASRKIAIPALLVALVALGAWMIHEIPRTIPRKLARKIAFEIDEMGYVQSNADRIAAECRKVLKFPAQDVRAAFQTRLEGRARQRDEFEMHLRTSQHVFSVFDGLVARAKSLKNEVCAVEL